jgi:beta propeller repeat protein
LKMKGAILFAILSLILGGCGRSKINGVVSTQVGEISKEVYYATSGYAAVLSENYMVVQENGLRVVDLNSKRVIKELEIPGNFAIGFDIYGTKVVWSAFSSEEEASQDPGYDETANTDIFLYDIAADKLSQITTNTAGQVMPDIWGDYIVWQDNRNDSVKDKNSEWDIYLYSMKTGEEKLITTAPGIHTNPSISDNKVVWEDGRSFNGEKELRWGGNVPENNTDIYMYDIKTDKEEAIATGQLQECNPAVYGSYVAWEDRNNKDYAAEIYLYDLNKKEKQRITNDKVDQSEPKLFDKYLVWTDERNGISTNDVYVNGKAPNSDIFLYDIEAKKEYLMTGKEPQIMPAISSSYIAYITSRQVNPEIAVIRYR